MNARATEYLRRMSERGCSGGIRIEWCAKWSSHVTLIYIRYKTFEKAAKKGKLARQTV